ncbi:carbonic anhydrase family protein [Leuconostoc kimchii]|uniref:A-type carbonic anhydrase n=2 Tax=Leuconostoc kimchii TaxID=136609 RepID=D5T3F3_LEUKI|nr:carbonic anhydrase family protein [Leuconostoc kimchii]ADG40802.1 A-type carbonic anhydrase [Leuconostoc kimchii IMSNU 11154]QBR48309.1 carbonic anhydrase family protein [Leuconostoc kimchii]
MKHLDYSQQESWREVGDTSFQSPIAISSQQAKNGMQPDLITHFSGQTLFEDRVVGEQFLVSGTLEIADETWTLERFHFHDGAEHLVDDVRHDIEIHFVYHHDDRILVLAVFGDVTSVESDTHIPEVFSEAIDAQLLTNWLPKDQSYYRYVGSLTTPPLGENVTWLVFSHPIAISEKDLSVIHQHYPNNYRDVQDIAGRDVLAVDLSK